MRLNRAVRGLFVATLLVCAGKAEAGVNSWTLSGPEGGWAYQAAFHPTNSQIAVLSTVRGLYRTTDGSAHWTLVNDGANGPDVAFDPTNGNRVLHAANGLWLSTDAGQTFSLAQSPADYLSQIEFSSAGTVYVGAQNGHLYRSTDHGNTWTSCGSLPATSRYLYTLAVDPNPNPHDHLFVAASDGFATASWTYRSVDDCASWLPVSSGDPAAPSTQVYHFAVKPGDPNRVLAATMLGICLSTDGGANWTSSPTYASWVEFDPHTPGVVIALGLGSSTQRSTDDGNTWNALYGAGVQNPGTGASFAFDTVNAGRILMATYIGPFLSSDGGQTFSPRNSGLHASYLQDFSTSDDGTVYATFSPGVPGVFRRDPSTLEWSALNNAGLAAAVGNLLFYTSHVATAPTNSSLIYAGAWNYKLARSNDGGAHWQGAHPTFANNSISTFDTVVDPGSAWVAYSATDHGIWKTTDGGTTWTQANSGLPAESRFVVAAPGSDVVYAIADDPASPNVNAVYKSSNAGASWSATGALPNASINYSASISIDPSNTNIVYVTGGSGLAKSVDGGATWKAATYSGLPGGFGGGQSLLIDPVYPTTIMQVGYPSFVARSVDGGANWESIPVDPGPERSLVRGVLDPLRPSVIIGGLLGATSAEYEVATDLSLSVSGLSASLGTSSSVAATLSIKNLGPHSASPSVLDVTVPTWLSPTVPGTCTRTLQTLHCQVPALQLNETHTLTLPLAVSAAGGTGQLTGTLTTHEADTASSNNHVALAVTGSELANLSLTLTPSAAAIDHDGTFSITAVVGNQGPSPSTGSTLSLPIPAGLTVNNFNNPVGGCTPNGNTNVLVCALGTLAAGTTTSLTLYGTGSSPGVQNISGHADGAGTDSGTAHDATASITVRPVGDASIDLAESADPVRVGTSFTYTATLRNLSGDASDVHLSMPVTGASVKAATPSAGNCTTTASRIDCDVTSLASGASATITIDLDAASVGIAAANATVTYAGTDTSSTNDSASIGTTLRLEGDLAVTIADSADPVTTGVAFDYTVNVLNNGPNDGGVHLSVPVTGATVASASMAGATCTNGSGTVTCDLASLAKGATATLTIGVSSATAGAASATATATFSGTDLVSTNDSATANTTVADPPAPSGSGGGSNSGGGGGSFDWLWLALLGALGAWRVRSAKIRASIGAVLVSACVAPAHAGVNSWTVTGPEGGFVTAAAICPTQPDTLLAQTRGGLYRSTDGGAHWSSQGTAIGTNSSIVFDPSDSTASRVYLASLKLYRSDDAGRTFSTFDTPVNYGITNFAVAADGTLYITDQSSRVFRSSDRGLTWSALTIAWPETLGAITIAIATDPNDANRLYVAVPTRGVFRSDDRGQTWISPAAGSPGTLTSTSTAIYFIAVQPGDSNRLLLAGDWAHYTSVDRGASWSAGYTTTMQKWVGFDPGAPAKAVSISVDGRVSRSLDGGVTWPAPSMGANLQVLYAGNAGFAASKPGRLLLATSDGPFLSDDGGVTFAQRTAGIHASTVGAFAAADDGTLYAAFETGSPGVFRQDSGGWSPLANGALRTTFGTPIRLTQLATAPTNRNLLYTITNNQYLAHSVDGGASWLGPSGDISVNAGAQGVVVDPSNPAVAYVPTYNQGLWRTTDGGNTWHPRTTGLPGRIDAIGIDPANTQVLYVLTTDTPHGIYKSVDGGLTWNPCADVALGTRLGFTFDPVDSQTVYVYSGADVLKTTNGGASWTQLDFGPPHGVYQRAMSVMVDPLLHDTLFVVGSQGASAFLRSVDGGASWESVELDVPQGEFLFLDRAILDPLRPNLLHVGVTDLGIVDYEVAPDLSISIDGLTSAMAADSTANGLVTVLNHGPLAASAADVRITIPDWAHVTVPQRCTLLGNALSCSLPALRVGQPFSLPLELAADQAPGQGQITASVAGHETDSVATNNDAALSLASTTQAKISLAFAIDATTVAHNANVLFTTRVSNPGPSRARDVRVELDLGTLAATDVIALPNTCERNGAKVSCQFGTLEAASSASFGVRADVTAIGANMVSGIATRAGNDADAITSGALALQAKPVADFSLALLDSPDPVAAGAAVSYTATVQNSGPDPGTSTVALQFSGVSVGSATTSAGTCVLSGGAVNCDLSSLASGASATITVAATAGAAGTATASGKVNFTGLDSSAANDSDAQSTTIAAPPGSGGGNSSGGGGGGSFDWLLLAGLGAALTFRSGRTFRRCAS